MNPTPQIMQLRFPNVFLGLLTLGRQVCPHFGQVALNRPGSLILLLHRVFRTSSHELPTGLVGVNGAEETEAFL